MSKIKLKEIHIDGGTQPREDIDIDTVQEYAEAMQEGDQFPPVVVFNDGARYWLADGFHRYHASNAIGYLDIEAEVKSGTQRDAILYSVSANAKHGLRRTNADKRKAVLTLLNDEEWSQWSDREIARKCEVSTPTVSKYRESICKNFTDEPTTRKVKRGDQEYTVDTSNIGKRDIFGKKITAETIHVGHNYEPELQGTEATKPIGFQRAYEAIALLEEIPEDDQDLPQAYDMVIDWIKLQK